MNDCPTGISLLRARANTGRKPLPTGVPQWLHSILLLTACAAVGGARAEWRVWTVTETRHVLRSESPATGTVAKLSAARNEWGDFQILTNSERRNK